MKFQSKKFCPGGQNFLLCKFLNRHEDDIAVHGHGFFNRTLDVNGVFGAPEAPDAGIFVPVAGDAGLDAQAVIVGVDAEERLGNGEERPGGGARQPAVLGAARDHLGVAVDFNEKSVVY